MEKKIEFEIGVFYNIVLFKINYMDERFRSLKGTESKIFVAKNGFEVCSSVYPVLVNYGVRLMGDDFQRDTRSSSYNCKTQKEAVDYKNKVIEALKDWAENWEGWKEESKYEEVQANNLTSVYSF